MNYITAEHLKQRHSFTIFLIVIAPLTAILLSAFTPLWLQINSFNWWYILLYPGFLTLLCVMVEQRDAGRLQYRAVLPLPVNIAQVLRAKEITAALYAGVANLIFLLLNLAGGAGVSFINNLPMPFSVERAFLGAICIYLCNIWQIPLCLFLTRKIGSAACMISHIGAGVILCLFSAAKPRWFLCPYAWGSHLMIDILGIMPNGVPLKTSLPPVPYSLIVVLAVLSTVLFYALSFFSARLFFGKETALS